METNVVSVRKRKVPTLYEADESKYVGPHHWQVQWWARGVRRLMRQRAYTRWVDQACEGIQINGLEYLDGLQGPCVFIGNHSSHLDTMVVHSAVPERFRSRLYFGAAQDRWFVKGKKKLELKPWYQSLVLGNFPILRGGGARALEYAHWLLKRRQHVFLFPEGTRATDDALGEFKLGAALLALQNGATIVPVYLGGLRDIRPKGSREVRRGSVVVEILEPVRLAGDSDAAEATRSLYRQMMAAHLRFRGVPEALPRVA